MIDAFLYALGLPSIEQMIDDYMPVIKAQQDLEKIERFRHCKSYKWQRRRNKQFYRILDGLRQSP